ncbi:helix-turn-helix domain-containing protein [Streptosporangiaceae bacterium NEAU-GS5]|nr:helix-turn-helix domain-containing protein [Streptosporangiaceae bacterium NEAU-GS5]
MKWMTVSEILTELKITRRTWQHWRAIGKAPKAKRLPNGKLRILREDYETWLESLAEEDAA